MEKYFNSKAIMFDEHENYNETVFVFKKYMLVVNNKYTLLTSKNNTQPEVLFQVNTEELAIKELDRALYD